MPALVHARGKFDELIKHGDSDVAAEAIRCMALIFKLEKAARNCNAQERLAIRQSRRSWTGTNCAPGCSASASGCRMAAALLAPSSTA
ncbi:hypothetical protein OOT46_02345 [Aquabacterium sp. A7-Y]|uniref:IS66 family transposase n=1 Tax=Aquabacterium sp. A7-Y TaxID=1349605 RepID=UPI00223D97F8|nr:transposase [Aquabacterium sp. A7-Y]MCW7536695.1 hypothetical protein [Aquabacterium sp. A7-Y]